LDYGQAGDFLKIAKVQRRNAKAKVQHGGANQQVRKRELDAQCFLLICDAPSQTSNLEP